MPDATRQYARDADDKLPEAARDQLLGDLDTDADLPEGSKDSGYRTGDWGLWFGPDDGERYAYLVDGKDVERWPRAQEGIGCA